MRRINLMTMVGRVDDVLRKMTGRPTKAEVLEAESRERRRRMDERQKAFQREIELRFQARQHEWDEMFEELARWNDQMIKETHAELDRQFMERMESLRDV